MNKAVAQLDELVLRRPCANDGAAIHALIAASPPLDTNTVYAYLLLAQYFSDTCILAVRGDDIAGFISGFIVPQRDDTLFIWQVAGHPDERGKGLALLMLERLLEEQKAKGLRFIETTVSPDNQGSRALFKSLARRYGVPLTESALFDCALFGGQSHEAEPLLRLGPFSK